MVGELATQMEVKVTDVLKHLMLDLGVMATITQSIDSNTARMVAGNFGVEVGTGKSLTRAGRDGGGSW